MNLAKTSLDGNLFYYKKNDVYIGRNIARGSYEPYFTKLLLRNIEPGDVVVDIGANIGFDTVNMAKRVGGKGRILAIEPESDNFEILKKNVAANKLKNVILIKAALGQRNGQTKLHKSKENFGDHKTYNDGSKSQVEIVEIKTLDRLMKEYKLERVDLIKSDTQGFEPAVLEGGRELIKKDKPILFFEYWPGGYKMADLNVNKMLDFLRKVYGDNLFFIDEYIQIYYRRDMAGVDKMLGNDNHCNLWATRKVGLVEKWGQVRDFWVKKFVKRGLGIYPLT